MACAVVGCASPSTRNYDGAFSILLDNDETTGSDNNYTSGVGFSWATNKVGTYEQGSFVRGWADFWSFLPYVADEEFQTYAAWTLGQETYTPDDISKPDPPPDDQPYAGVLYVDSLLYARNERWGHTWNLRLGIVGPSSLAEDGQRLAHDAIGANEPLGWDTQMPDEPLINVGYSADYLWLDGELGESTSWRMVPTINAELGTYLVGLGGGIYGEVGWNLPDAFGGRNLRTRMKPALTVGVAPQDAWSLSLYAGVGGYGIAHFLPLDGTVFKDSRSVDSNPFLGIATGGISLRRKRFAMNVAVTSFTETFETERERTSFGSWVFAWYF